MRSLRYLMGGGPRNLDDCLDFAKTRGDLGQVIVGLATIESMAHQRIQERLIARFEWHFRSGVVRYSRSLGTYCLHEPLEAQRDCVENANRRLATLIERTENAGAEVIGNADRFSCALTPNARGARSTERHVSRRQPRRPQDDRAEAFVPCVDPSTVRSDEASPEMRMLDVGQCGG